MRMQDFFKIFFGRFCMIWDTEMQLFQGFAALSRIHAYPRFLLLVPPPTNSSDFKGLSTICRGRISLCNSTKDLSACYIRATTPSISSLKPYNQPIYRQQKRARQALFLNQHIIFLTIE